MRGKKNKWLIYLSEFMRMREREGSGKGLRESMERTCRMSCREIKAGSERERQQEIEQQKEREREK